MLSGIEALVSWCSPALRGLMQGLTASERQQSSSGKGWFPASSAEAKESLVGIDRYSLPRRDAEKSCGRIVPKA